MIDLDATSALTLRGATRRESRFVCVRAKRARGVSQLPCASASMSAPGAPPTLPPATPPAPEAPPASPPFNHRLLESCVDYSPSTHGGSTYSDAPTFCAPRPPHPAPRGTPTPLAAHTGTAVYRVFPIVHAGKFGGFKASTVASALGCAGVHTNYNLQLLNFTFTSQSKPNNM